MAKTLIDSLVPMVDSLRHLHDSFGTRPYKVTLVRTQWSGGRRGLGTEALVSEVDLDPTPKVTGIGGTSFDLSAVGLSEDGGVTVSQISLSYTESELFPDLGPDEQFWYEVSLKSDASHRMRFFPAAKPEQRPTEVGWVIHLKTQDVPREYDGRLG